MWAHTLFLRLGVMLGAVNFLVMMSATMLVLLSQEIYGLDAAGHGLLLAAGAVGGVLGGFLAPQIIERIGTQKALFAALASFPLPFVLLAFTGSPWVAGLALAIEMFAGMVWNVVTVTLRQRHIPAGLLGRVNAIYRFLGWGPIPLGAVVAGLLVAWGQASGLERDMALRVPYIAGALAMPLIFVYGLARLRLP